MSVMCSYTLIDPYFQLVTRMHSLLLYSRSHGQCLLYIEPHLLAAQVMPHTFFGPIQHLSFSTGSPAHQQACDRAAHREWKHDSMIHAHLQVDQGAANMPTCFLPCRKPAQHIDKELILLLDDG